MFDHIEWEDMVETEENDPSEENWSWKRFTMAPSITLEFTEEGEEGEPKISKDLRAEWEELKDLILDISRQVLED